ncbi:MAG TPA: DUF6431 domain-containing protein [Trebonia sp.]
MIKAKCAPYRQQDKPWHRPGLQNLDDHDIVRTYGAEYRGVVRCQAATPAAPCRGETGGPILTGWTMIEAFDATAASTALARRKLGCPDCRQPLRPWGHARERTVRDTGGALVTVRPDRALCTGCKVTHVVLDARLLPRRGYTAGLIGQALVAPRLGPGTGASHWT